MFKLFGSFIVIIALVPTCSGATLAYSTYLKDGFTPAAIASDGAGNLYLAGNAVVDPLSSQTSVAVAKLDPKAGAILYLTYLDSVSSDQVSSIAVDSAGNAYIVGWTANANFPQTPGSQFATTPTPGTQRAYVSKLNANGSIAFSVLLGGSTSNVGLGIAVTPAGQILVSGRSNGAGFPSTPGAYSVSNTLSQWFLMELDAAASKMIFSATGIGGSSLVLDSSGNIYMSGSSPDPSSFGGGPSYPTTPGAFQTTFTPSYYCLGLCQFGVAGGLQHVTKVDPAASRLIYSTGLNGPGDSGNNTNTGLAVDAEGNAYVTGVVQAGLYPFTATVPPLPYQFSYLSKLDPTGASLLFSVPVGGGGVQLDASGTLYLSGVLTNANPELFFVPGTHSPLSPPAALSWVPQPCLSNGITSASQVYAMTIDPASGGTLDAQWIDGTGPGVAGVTLAGGKVWITGATPIPDVPFTPGALAPPGLPTGMLAGVYLSAVDFATPPQPTASSGPLIACVLDGGDLMHVGPVSSGRLLSLFGANLAPAGGVTVTFDGSPAELLYVSSSQINLAAPNWTSARSVTVMQISANANGAVSSSRQFPIAQAFSLPILNLFANPVFDNESESYLPVVLNADGSFNSQANPAPYGSMLSFFMHGTFVQGNAGAHLPDIQALGACAKPAVTVSQPSPYVYQVDVQTTQPSTGCQGRVTFSAAGTPVGPVAIPVPGAYNAGPAGVPIPMPIWLK